MHDLISRQAAIDTLEERLRANGYSNVALVSELNRSIGYLMRLPSAEPERKTERWIPCSERLPEKHQMVITTIIGTDVIRMIPGETFEDALARVRNHVRVSVGYIEDDEWYGADGYPQIVKPIAWMPMPEPFRGDEDD